MDAGNCRRRRQNKRSAERESRDFLVTHSNPFHWIGQSRTPLGLLFFVFFIISTFAMISFYIYYGYCNHISISCSFEIFHPTSDPGFGQPCELPLLGCSSQWPEDSSATHKMLARHSLGPSQLTKAALRWVEFPPLNFPPHRIPGLGPVPWQCQSTLFDAKCGRKLTKCRRLNPSPTLPGIANTR